jgi:mannose-6-phosphate isomerase-like protein (cupin superfamily)
MATDQTTKKPNYRVKKDAIHVRRARPSSAANEGVILSSQRVYGTENSIMFADRGPGYHTRPHRHDAEQINYIVSGEIWFFVEGHGYRCGPGDIMRIPRNRVHWAYNRGSEHAVIIESHCPPLIGNDAEARKTAEPLLGPDEDAAKVNYVVNQVVPLDPKDVAEVEARAFAEEG